VQDRALILILCFSESSLNYEANHQDNYIGICGVNPTIWSDYLNNKGIDYNSLQGGLTVYNYYLEKTNDKKKAILKYKKVVKSKKVKKIVDKIIVIEKELK
jgi:hypothetical protein